MSIRNTWNRMLRRTSTGSTTSSSSGSDTAITPASTAPSSPGWGPSATFSWLVPTSSKISSGSPSPTSGPAVATQPLPHSKSDKEKKKSKKYYSSSSSGNKKRVHPSERPLTKENLRHQELFANFSFGEPDGSSRGFGSRHSYDSGISPCNSRRNSFA
ncbi:hypothetical protein PpBr36_03563 [Pyricularia pennisetigena]|uniref:hypothetical protein n=1 Tax=Pyricularia pennisetigena TaxID=1578925 RepID=UPI0011513EC3|nr:hypothetical protein PpBr36_03563 [Pyricularia pennisetigena]TLS31566.1 hypothetical protein PpBr36_03563 [Pyricularia pennisetigena]